MQQWWKNSVVYQVYTRSFKDSNNDGIGDLKGVISKLDYLSYLGVDAIWFNPIYESPNADNGYDISDYRAIMAEFGTMEDFENLTKKAHSMGMKIIMDLVVNHCSDEHMWFKEGRKSKDNKYHDYFIWQDKKNNWKSYFEPSAWEYNDATKEYYLHLFATKQPDLNWENPSLRKEVYDIVRFWLEKGVDGFRLDTANMYSKVAGFPDVNPPKLATEYFWNGPKIHEYLNEMHLNCFEDEVMSVGETPGLDVEMALLYTAEERKELSMVNVFDHMFLDHQWDNKWNLEEYQPKTLKESFIYWQKGIEKKGWIALYLSNHDFPRHVSRYGSTKEYLHESAKALATITFTLKGTTFMFQGEEIAMTNACFEIDEYRDLDVINHLKEVGHTEENLKAAQYINRDNARTPMQWNTQKNAGFSNGKPWIKVNENYEEINVEKQLKDENSVLEYYRKLIKLRKEIPALCIGSFKEINNLDENIFAYKREYNGFNVVVVINLCKERLACKDFEGEVLLTNYNKHDKDYLKPYEAIIIKI